MNYLETILEEMKGMDARYIRGCRLDDPDRLAFYLALERHWPIIEAALKRRVEAGIQS